VPKQQMQQNQGFQPVANFIFSKQWKNIFEKWNKEKF
jgi:hypothetical protein